MLNFYDFSNTTLLLCFSVVIFSVMFVVTAYVFRLQNIKHKKNITQMLKKIDLITLASVGMGQRLIDLESNIVSLRDVQDEFKDKDLDFSYGQAHRMISQGLSNDAVAANSGLSVSEVSLMELMHQENKGVDKRDILNDPVTTHKNSARASETERTQNNNKQQKKTRSFRSAGLLESI